MAGLYLIQKKQASTFNDQRLGHQGLWEVLSQGHSTRSQEVDELLTKYCHGQEEALEKELTLWQKYFQ